MQGHAACTAKYQGRIKRWHFTSYTSPLTCYTASTAKKSKIKRWHFTSYTSPLTCYTASTAKKSKIKRWHLNIGTPPKHAMQNAHPPRAKATRNNSPQNRLGGIDSQDKADMPNHGYLLLFALEHDPLHLSICCPAQPFPQDQYLFNLPTSTSCLWQQCLLLVKLFHASSLRIFHKRG